MNEAQLLWRKIGEIFKEVPSKDSKQKMINEEFQKRYNFFPYLWLNGGSSRLPFAWKTENYESGKNCDEKVEIEKINW